MKRTAKAENVMIPSDRNKIIEIATLLGCEVKEKKGSIIMGDRRFTFNAAGEIVKIQDVKWSGDGSCKYITLAEDKTHKAEKTKEFA